MTLASVLQACDRLGVTLQVKGDALHIQAPKGAISANALAFLKKYKEDITAHLRGDTVLDEQREAYEERAAIMEYDGGLSRAAAERAAYAIMLIKSPHP